jgi:hypothetical protein
MRSGRGDCHVCKALVIVFTAPTAKLLAAAFYINVKFNYGGGALSDIYISAGCGRNPAKDVDLTSSTDLEDSTLMASEVGGFFDQDGSQHMDNHPDNQMMTMPLYRTSPSFR